MIKAFTRLVAIKSTKPDKGKKIVIRYIPIVIGINPKGFLRESNKISSSSVSVREVNFFRELTPRFAKTHLKIKETIKMNNEIRTSDMLIPKKPEVHT